MTTPPGITRTIGHTPGTGVNNNRLRRIGRAIHHLSTEDGLSGTSNTKRIIPVAEAWPHSVDDNGVSYPGGLVAVRFTYGLLDDDATNNIAGRIIAVPSTLPTGYTKSVLMELSSRKIRVNSHSSFVPLMPSLRIGAPGYKYGWLTTGSDGGDCIFISNTDGITPYFWMPENSGQYVWSDLARGSITEGGPTFAASPSAGFRYLQIRFTHNAPITRQFRFQIWRSPTNHLVPDTKVYEVTTAGTGSLTNFDTGVVLHDGGANNFYAPTLGTRVNWFAFMHWDLGGGAGWEPVPIANQEGMDVSVTLAPRLDIPLPWTVTGTGSLFAPGGIVTGAITGY